MLSRDWRRTVRGTYRRIGGSMISERIDPPGLARIPGSSNVVVATGTRLVCVSGQTGVDEDGKVVGATHLEQARQALANLRTALHAASASPNHLPTPPTYLLHY